MFIAFNWIGLNYRSGREGGHVASACVIGNFSKFIKKSNANKSPSNENLPINNFTEKM